VTVEIMKVVQYCDKNSWSLNPSSAV